MIKTTLVACTLTAGAILTGMLAIGPAEQPAVQEVQPEIVFIDMVPGETRETHVAYQAWVSSLNTKSYYVINEPDAGSFRDALAAALQCQPQCRRIDRVIVGDRPAPNAEHMRHIREVMARDLPWVRLQTTEQFVRGVARGDSP